jgi:hypothetical protein
MIPMMNANRMLIAVAIVVVVDVVGMMIVVVEFDQCVNESLHSLHMLV